VPSAPQVPRPWRVSALASIVSFDAPYRARSRPPRRRSFDFKCEDCDTPTQQNRSNLIVLGALLGCFALIIFTPAYKRRLHCSFASPRSLSGSLEA